MESIPSLPATATLRWLVIFALCGIIGLLVAWAQACRRKDWPMARHTAGPLLILGFALGIGHTVQWIHAPAMLVCVAWAAWNGSKTRGTIRWASFLGALALFGSVVAAWVIF